MAFPPNVLYCGRPDPPPPQVPLRAGALEMIFQGGDLRYIRLGSREIIRRWHVAVRDRDWGTVPLEVRNLQMGEVRNGFSITYDGRHAQHPIDFSWHASIRGDGNGICFTMDGVANTTFLRNRIGFCILHPDVDCAGRSCVVRHVDGSEERGQFPPLISPHQPFKEIAAFSHEVSTGLWAELEFEGDVFEMEDQRNWIDASFKTYCTPLDLSFPVLLPAGTRIRQSVRMTLRGRLPTVQREHRPRPITLQFEEASSPLPRIGLCARSEAEPPSAQQISRLRALHPSHLRVDIPMRTEDAGMVLHRAIKEAASIGASVEAVLYFSENADDEVQRVGREIARLPDDLRARIGRFLVHHLKHKATPAELLRIVRPSMEEAAPSAQIGGGTDAYFTELNRHRLSVDLVDAVCYSINPQVHAFDELSLAETPSAIGATVQSARQFCGRLPIIVTPVTLRPRFNPDATSSSAALASNQLPPQVDPRQMSLAGACWTLASLKALAEAGAASATFYETVGWLGVMERHAGPPLPALFPSLADECFPLYHVLADVGELAGGAVMRVSSSDPLRVQALLLRRGERHRLMLANMTDQLQTVQCRLHACRFRQLDQTTVMQARISAEQFRTAWTPWPADEEFELHPYGVCTMDLK